MISLMVTMMVSVSVTNVQMKVIDRDAKSNFYSAEVAVDEMKAGLQKAMAEILEIAYSNILNQYADLTLGERNIRFKEEFITQFLKKFGLVYIDGRTGVGTYDVSKLEDYLDKTKSYTSIKTATGMNQVDWSYDATSMDPQYLNLRNVEVIYTDSKNYRTTIKSDYKFQIPEVEFDSIGSVPSFAEYAVIADDSIMVQDQVGSIIGNVYAGANGIVANGGNLQILVDLLVTRGDLVANNAGKLSIRKQTEGEIWANNIETQATTSGGAEIWLNSNIYISDDVTLNAQNSKVKLEGNYYGYGYGYPNGSTIGTLSEYKAEYSSAMILNRSKCTLDLSNLNNIFLAGRAFITPEQSDLSKVDGSLSGTAESVLTGEAISMKANQVLYWIPGGAIGVKDGQALNQNPITLTTYQKIINTTNQYTEVNMDYQVPFGSNRPLSYYASGYIKIFDNTKTEPMVYYYPKFKNEVLANEYFEDASTDIEYQKRLSTSLAQYQCTILKPVNFASTTGRKTYAGNLVIYRHNEKALEIMRNTVAANLPDQFIKESNDLAKEYDALSKKLVRSLAAYPESSYDTTSTFKSILAGVDSTEPTVGFNALIKDSINMVDGNKILVKDTSYGRYILVDNKASGIAFKVTNAYVNDTTPCIIVATGDVTLQRNMTGLILSGGTVHLENNATIQASASLLFELIDKTDVRIIFRDYSGFGYYLRDEEQNTVSIEKLITTENWSRK